MKLQECREAYYEASAKTSDIIRYLGFAGIALIWLFREENKGVISISPPLVSIARLLVIGLILDLFQYVSRTIIWGLFSHFKDRAGTSNDDEVKPNTMINWIPLLFFWAKTFVMILAYIYLIEFLFTNFVPNTK